MGTLDEKKDDFEQQEPLLSWLQQDLWLVDDLLQILERDDSIVAVG